MKRFVMATLLCLIISACCVGCGNQKKQTTTIANPWSDCASLKEAENAAGFSFGLPETIADGYTAAAFRTQNNELIEVIYREEDSEVRVRKQKGEGQDISGDYNNYDTCTEETVNGAVVTTCHNADNNAVKQTISYQGYSWSLTAPDGYWGDSNWDFVNHILGIGF